MEGHHAGTYAAGIPESGYEVFPGGQSVDATSGIGNGNEVVVLPHQFDPNCAECRRLSYERYQEEASIRPFQPWEPIDPTRQFYELPPLGMEEEQFFQSLSDIEDVTFFNQPYLVHYGDELEQDQQQHQQQQQSFPSLFSLAEESLAFGQSVPQDEAIEPLLFQRAEVFEHVAFEPPAFQPVAFEHTVFEATDLEPMPAPVLVEPLMYEPLMFEAPTFVPAAVERTALQPEEFNFNTLPHGSVQQPNLSEPWATTHDGGLFEQPSDHDIKREASDEASALFSSMMLQTTETTPSVQYVRNRVRFESPVPRRAPSARQTPVPAPRRLLPSNGHRQRPVHRQPNMRARRLPVLQLSSQEGSERAAKDLFLVQSRLDNISYKEIKRLGKFTEAESTLRGRYRTLTKAKKDRVRDPKWTSSDIHLLKEAVRVLGHGVHPARAKLSWMAVSNYISNHGGSYEFGYSTCHRRWTHLEATGQLGDNGYDDSWEDEDEEEALAEEAPEEAKDGDEKDETAEENEYPDEDCDMSECDEEAVKEERGSDMKGETESESDDDDDDEGVPIKDEE
ncbi:hypothetical protein V8C42DRAFT_359204 [Trichoderma barbatum]